MGYASRTEVSVDRSKGELKKVVYKCGATNYKYAEEEDRAMVMFDYAGRRIRFMIRFPPPESKQFTHTSEKGIKRTKEAAYKAYEAEQRRRWRALILAIKAKFEVVQSGIATFDEEFLAYILLPNGQTVSDAAIPSVTQAYETGKMPDNKLIPEFT